ncbi:MAG: hypothetical protein LBG82_06075 [Clostridiales Family XIII bacterium]|jgi:hypothetical protein|nr:hypothetical protein [Clostridiales Family XIII bacterium]
MAGEKDKVKFVSGGAERNEMGEDQEHGSTDASTIESELERRIADMEDEGYEYPKRFGRRDYIFVGIAVALCVFAVVAGAFL